MRSQDPIRPPLQAAGGRGSVETSLNMGPHGSVHCPSPGCVGYATCGANTKNTGEPCQNAAGKGTDHLGFGRCRYHGGLTPIRSGRYSKIKREALRDLIAEYEADPDPLNILPELAASRALFQDFIERYDKWAVALLAWHESWNADEDGSPRPAKPRQILDIADAYRIVSEITKIVERIEKIRAANAISRPDLLRVMTEMGRVVEAYVPDEAAREKIKQGWLTIRVG